MKKIFVIFCLTLLIFSCKKSKIVGAGGGDSETVDDVSRRESKLFFAKTLAKALEKEPDMRILIKEEGKKMFDNDYDVFFRTVKDVIVSDNETFEEKLYKYASSKDSLNAAIEDIPLLTILIPELPEFNVFSWDALNEIPSVAVEPLKIGAKEDVVAFYGPDTKFVIPFGLLPAEPTIVVKENERVIVNSQKNRSSVTMNIQGKFNNTSPNVFLNKNGISFAFADEVFNGQGDKVVEKKRVSKIIMANILKTSAVRPTVDRRQIQLSEVKHIIDAIGSGAEWQRDNIYYGINPSIGVNSGKLNRKVRECIVAIRFTGGVQMYDQIKVPGDPIPIEEGSNYQEWTGGGYEFRLKAIINSKNGTGADVEKIIYAQPSQLFEIYYTKRTKPRGDTGPGSYFWGGHLTENSSKIYTLPTPLDIDSWDLETKSLGWQISFMRYSPNQTYTTVISEGSEYATNFELSLPLGEVVKVGAKFGSSQKFTSNTSRTVSKVTGPLDLGQANIDFTRPIWKSYLMYNDGSVGYEPNELQLSTNCFLTIEPRIK